MTPPPLSAYLMSVGFSFGADERKICSVKSSVGLASRPTSENRPLTLARGICDLWGKVWAMPMGPLTRHEVV